MSEVWDICSQHWLASPFVIYWSKHRLGLPQSQWIVVQLDRWELPPFCRGNWVALAVSLHSPGGRQMPAARVVQWDCERVYGRRECFVNISACLSDMRMRCLQHLPRIMRTKFAFVIQLHILTDLIHILCRLTSPALGQSHDCPSTSEATLNDMGKELTYIHWEPISWTKSKQSKATHGAHWIGCLFSIPGKQQCDESEPNTRNSSALAITFLCTCIYIYISMA